MSGNWGKMNLFLKNEKKGEIRGKMADFQNFSKILINL